MKISGYMRRLVLAGVVLGALAAAPGALAVVVHEPHGQFLSVAVHPGVSPASIPGSVAAQHAATPFSSNGNLNYHSGPVVHSSAPYLIFWTPAGETLSAATESLLARYLADTAAASGKSGNIFGVDRQYTDAAGFADYKQTFSSATQAIVDTQPYPTTGQCTSPGSFPTCLTDAQIQAEIARLIGADGLPTDGSTSASELNQNAPVYFVVLPSDVDECMPGSNPTPCASNVFCAYHSSFSSGGQNVLYSVMPTLFPALAPKGCQFDGFRAPQSPNGNQVGDSVIDLISHEYSETLTDPLGTAWWNSKTGLEGGDECSFFGSFHPNKGENPDAWTPKLGGVPAQGIPATGTLFNQRINGDVYYTQSEWSNGVINCKRWPSHGSVSAKFSASAGPVAGTPVSFDPSASSSTNGYSSVSWDFGDGATSFHRGSPTAVSHTYSTPGNYTVRLTLVDPQGGISRVSHLVTVT